MLQLCREGFTFPLEGLVQYLVLAELVFELLVLTLKGFQLDLKKFLLVRCRLVLILLQEIVYL